MSSDRLLRSPTSWRHGATLLIVGIILYGRPQNVTGEVILLTASMLSVVALLNGRTPQVWPLGPWMFVSLTVISSFWSDNPGATFRYAVSAVVALFVAAQIASSLPYPLFIKLLDHTTRALVLACVLLAIIFPHIGLHNDLHAGALRGIYVHKNGMGFMLILALVSLLANRWQGGVGKTSLAAWGVLYTTCLIWSESVGALALAVAALGIFGIVRWLSREDASHRGLIVVIISCFASIVAILAVSGISQIFELVGKDLTFTNRIYIWQGVIEAWRQHLWLGYGWANILGDRADAAATISQYAGYSVTSTHNGYLATALQLGIVGLAIMVLILGSLFFRILKLTLEAPTAYSTWMALMLLVLILGDFLETRAMVNIGWFLLCLIACYSSKPLYEPQDSLDTAGRTFQFLPASSLTPKVR